MEGASVLELPWTTYLWVFGLSILGGMVGYLNKPEGHSWRETGIIIVTSCFNGFMIICVCVASGFRTEIAMFACGIVGMMGRRAWRDFERLLRTYLRILADQYGSDDYPPDYPPNNRPPEYPNDHDMPRGSWGVDDNFNSPRRPINRRDDEVDYD